MIYFASIVGLAVLAAIVYMALNKKSSFAVRIASLIALAVMITAVLICVFVVLTGGKAPVDESVVIVGAVQEAQKAESGNSMVILVFIIFLLGFFAAIAYLSLKDHRKRNPSAELNF
ncbi:MAG: hypothetical protein LBH44_00485 [Treponema sp.]|jgi:heme A synthase|nr:hypothetical protein [Treponema sp.]